MPPSGAPVVICESWSWIVSRSVSIFISHFGRETNKQVTRFAADSPSGLPERLVLDIARFVAQIEIDDKAKQEDL